MVLHDQALQSVRLTCHSQRDLPFALILVHDGTLTAANSILWGNSDNGGSGRIDDALTSVTLAARRMCRIDRILSPLASDHKGLISAIREFGCVEILSP